MTPQTDATPETVRRYRRDEPPTPTGRRRKLALVVVGAVALGLVTGLSVPVDGTTGWPRLTERLGVAMPSLDLHLPVMPWQYRKTDPALDAVARGYGWLGPPKPLQRIGVAWQGSRPWWEWNERPNSVFRRAFLPLMGPDPLGLTPWQQRRLRDRSLDPRPIEPLARLAGVPVMMYHDVVDGPKDVSFDETLEQFERDLRMIEEAGATPISLRQWWNYITRAEPLPAKPILLTFDDGYKSCYTLIYPRLKARGWPAVFFIIPPYVGAGPGSDWYQGKKDHITWDEITEMQATGLYEFQSHTMTHPYLTRENDETVTRELVESRKYIEKKLGNVVQFLCYPIGDRDERVISLAKNAGYVAAFTMKTGLSADSPSIMEVQRYDCSILSQALAASDGRIEVHAPPMKPTADLTRPVRFHRRMVDIGFGDIPICWVTGGRPTTVHGDYRYGVPDVARKAGAAAGINGGFFGMASLHGTGNHMIGPVMASYSTARDEDLWDRRQIAEPRDVFLSPRYIGGAEREIDRLAGRPLVLISPTGMRFVPFEPRSMNSQVAMDILLPGVSEAFIAGAWLVRDGRALSSEEHDTYATGDHDDPRRRAFFGITADGRPVIGASPSSQSSETMGEVLAELGIDHAVLLDSGYSSSLYYNGSIFVTGHSDAKPSRPVPHTILLMEPRDAPVAGAVGNVASRLESLARWARDDDQADYLPPTSRLVDVDE